MKAIYADVFSYSECTKSSNSGKKEAPSDTIKTEMSRHAHSIILKSLLMYQQDLKCFQEIINNNIGFPMKSSLPQISI